MFERARFVGPIKVTIGDGTKELGYDAETGRFTVSGWLVLPAVSDDLSSDAALKNILAAPK